MLFIFYFSPAIPSVVVLGGAVEVENELKKLLEEINSHKSSQTAVGNSFYY